MRTLRKKKKNQKDTNLVEPTIVDAAVDNRTGRREKTNDTDVQAHVDGQHERAVYAPEQHDRRRRVVRRACFRCPATLSHTSPFGGGRRVAVVHRSARCDRTPVAVHRRQPQSTERSALRMWTLVTAVDRRSKSVYAASVRRSKNGPNGTRTYAQNNNRRVALSTQTESGIITYRRAARPCRSGCRATKTRQ